MPHLQCVPYRILGNPATIYKSIGNQSSFGLRTTCLYVMVILLKRRLSLHGSSPVFIILCLEHPNPLFAQACLYFEVLNH